MDVKEQPLPDNIDKKPLDATGFFKRPDLKGKAIINDLGDFDSQKKADIKKEKRDEGGNKQNNEKTAEDVNKTPDSQKQKGEISESDYDFINLYNKIRKDGPIKGSQQTYEPEKLISVIESAVNHATSPENIEEYGKKISSDNIFFRRITNSGGIRNEVFNILKKRGFEIVTEKEKEDTAPKADRIEGVEEKKEAPKRPNVEGVPISWKRTKGDYQKMLEENLANAEKKLADKTQQNEEASGRLGKIFGKMFNSENMTQAAEEERLLREEVEKIKNQVTKLKEHFEEKDNNPMEKVA